MKNKIIFLLVLLIPSLCFGKNLEFTITEFNGHSSSYSGIGKTLFKNGLPDSGKDRIPGITRILVKDNDDVIISHNNGIKESKAVYFGEKSLLIREDYLKEGVTSQFIIHLTHKNEKNPNQVLVTFIRMKDQLFTSTGHYWGWATVKIL